MRRRDFLAGGAALTAAAALPRGASADTPFTPKPDAWRKFEIVTRVEIVKPSGKAQAWLPLPAVSEPDWTQPLGNEWKTNASAAVLERDPKYSAQMLHLQWKDGEQAPTAEVVSRIATRDRAVDLSKPGTVPPLSEAERKLYTASTELMPTDGIVKTTADGIVGWAFSDVEKARRIYEWIVDNTFRNPKTRGCGIGDIASMLKTGDLSGKCADLNALYVGLARAAGLPARDIYGIRIAPSKFGYKSLGAGSEVVSKAQHCRAEVSLARFGWVPVDPADVRKVVLEEPPGQLALTDPKVVAARKTLFGAWEMNWLAYNVAHDIDLPGSSGPKVGFLMYPQAEVGGERLDSLEPDSFKYVITAKEIAA
ncbi:MAG TPA: transglutaminase-like domain-containing protein [Xanthobacteraceae bacterium]|nr:transglutaminase-like domain-containing protein [Xanthobacteraceae bacterium]